MRTTVTLDPEVALLLREAMHRTRGTFKEVLNGAIRAGLQPHRTEPPSRYRVEPHRARLRPGFDPQGFNRLADELEDDAILAALHRGARP